MRGRPWERWVLALAVAGVLFGLPGSGGAQIPDIGPNSVRITLSQTAVTFPMPGLSDFDLGWVDASGLVVYVRPRFDQPGPWELRILTDDTDMGGYGKPVTDILWRPAGSTTWTPLTNTDQAVIQGTGNEDVTVYLRLRLDYAFDAPDSYAANVTFYAVTL